MLERTMSISRACALALTALSLGCSSGGSSGGGGFAADPGRMSAAFFPVTLEGTGGGLGNLAFAADGELLAVGGGSDALFGVSRVDGSRREIASDVSGGDALLSVVELEDVVYIGDDAGNLHSVDADGVVSSFIDPGDGAINGLAIAPEGYGAFGGHIVAATSAGGVIRIDPADLDSRFDLVPFGGIIYTDLEFDAAGILYVVDQSGGQVVTVAADGTVVPFASGFVLPAGLAVDDVNEQLFVADSGTDTLSSVRLSDGVVTAVGAFAFFDGPPSGLAFDGVSTLVVATSGSLVLRSASVPALDAVLFPIAIEGADVGAGALTLDGNGDFLGTANLTGIQGNEVFRVSRESGAVTTLASDLGAAGDGLYAIAFEPVSEVTYVGSDDGDIFAVESDGSTSTLVGLGDPINGLAFAPDTFPVLAGRLFAVTDEGEVFAVDIDDPGVPVAFATVEDGVDGPHRLLGLVFAADGTLFVADDTAHQIRKVSDTGTDAFFADLLAGFAGNLCVVPVDHCVTPDGLAIDEGSGRLFVADSFNDALVAVSLYDGAVSLEGTVSSLAGFNFDDGFRPSGMAFDRLGTLMVGIGESVLRLRRFAAFPPGFDGDDFPIDLPETDQSAGGLTFDVDGSLLGTANDLVNDTNEVFVVHRDGAFEVLRTNVGDPTLEALLGIAYEPISGSAFVGTDAGNIYEVDSSGGFSRLLNVPGQAINGLAIAPSTFDELRDQLVVVTASGDVLSIDPANPAPVLIVATGSTLTDLVFSSAGELYVADAVAGEIDTVEPAGAVANFASGLDFPDGLAIDEAGGRLFVAESGTPPGMLSSVSIPGGVVTNLAPFDFDDGSAPSGVAYDERGTVLVLTGETEATVEAWVTGP